MYFFSWIFVILTNQLFSTFLNKINVVLDLLTTSSKSGKPKKKLEDNTQDR